MSLSDLFVDPVGLPNDVYGFVQLVFLIVVYGYILFRASKLISDGSELLMLVLSPGLVGGLVLPVMGAIPDGAVVLFSGIGGSSPQVQLNNLGVGVGTLAGSTIMLLTIPWAVCAWLGRVDLTEDKCNANYRKGLTPGRTFWNTLTHTGIQTTSIVNPAAKIMCLTALVYLVIQVPAFAFGGSSTKVSSPSLGNDLHYWALAAFLISILSFIGECAGEVSCVTLRRSYRISYPLPPPPPPPPNH